MLNTQYSILNTQYKRAQTDLDIKGLTDVEKEWIKFRDLNCDYIYRSYSPGAESGMEKMSCLISLSSARESEIAYMRSGVLNDGFNTALYISEEISEEVRGYFIDQVKRRYNLPDNGVYFEKIAAYLNHFMVKISSSA
ncbi:lysozyme inhibitor LprI family protein [Pseudomonas sp. PDM19]|uniref:lysozyme inhibitor LprI family protein n=1 Tax=Pseudomonas sp. PDM19 TaxID=2769272 RepID=UPI00399A8A21